MSFDWMHPQIPESWRARWPEQGREAARNAVREQAALLMRLGRTKKAAAARCKQNLRWEWELTGGKPPLLADVDDLVDEVYRRTLTLDPQGGASTRGR
ncbi:MAG: hypothetical protein ACOCUS_04345 [Polyangiales bacterium]